MRVIYLDCVSGASGDMLLGALLAAMAARWQRIADQLPGLYGGTVAQLRRQVREILAKLGKKLIIPEEIVHYSEWVHAMRDRIAEHCSMAINFQHPIRASAATRQRRPCQTVNGPPFHEDQVARINRMLHVCIGMVLGCPLIQIRLDLVKLFSKQICGHDQVTYPLIMRCAR